MPDEITALEGVIEYEPAFVGAVAEFVPENVLSKLVTLSLNARPVAVTVIVGAAEPKVMDLLSAVITSGRAVTEISKAVVLVLL